MRYDDKKLLALFEKFMEITRQIDDPHNRKAIERLMDDVGERFFEAPASGKLEWHNCFAGGLCAHSMNVYHILKDLCAKFHKDVNPDDIIIAALFHDLGKAGYNGTPYYVPKNSKWHLEKMGLVYDINQELNWMPHAQRSVLVLNEYEVNLSEMVTVGILIHDGQYVEANKSYAMKEGMFPLLVSMADRLATEIEKNKWESIQ